MTVNEAGEFIGLAAICFGSFGFGILGMAVYCRRIRRQRDRAIRQEHKLDRRVHELIDERDAATQRANHWQHLHEGLTALYMAQGDELVRMTVERDEAMEKFTNHRRFNERFLIERREQRATIATLRSERAAAIGSLHDAQAQYDSDCLSIRVRDDEIATLRAALVTAQAAIPTMWLAAAQAENARLRAKLAPFERAHGKGGRFVAKSAGVAPGYQFTIPPGQRVAQSAVAAADDLEPAFYGDWAR